MKPAAYEQTGLSPRRPADRTLSSNTARRVGGAQLLYASSANDMTLLRLNDTPIYFAGWMLVPKILGSLSLDCITHWAIYLKLVLVSCLVMPLALSSRAVSCAMVQFHKIYYRVNWSQGTTQGE